MKIQTFVEIPGRGPQVAFSASAVWINLNEHAYLESKMPSAPFKKIASLLALALFASMSTRATAAPAATTAPKPNAKSAATSAAQKPTTKTRKTFKLLRPAEIRKLSRPKRRIYYRTLHAMLTTLSKKKVNKKTASIESLLLPRAKAADQAQGACLIGGYFGRWEQVGSRLTCAKPDAGQVWESEKEEFSCGKSATGESMGHCNSAFYLYANDQHQRMCEPVATLNESCAKKFEARYLTDEGAERLVNDTAHLIAQMGSEELEDYYLRLDDALNAMIESKDRDQASAQILRKQLEVLNGLRMNSAGVVDGKDDNPETNTDTSTKPNPDTAPDAEPNTEPRLPAPSQSKLLGKELTCIRDGLTSLGLSPSEKYLSLLGVGVQMSRGPYKTTQDPEALKQFQSEVIATVQAFGFCSEAVYPSTNLADSQSAMNVRNLLTAANGKITGGGMDYIGQALDSDARNRSAHFYRLFGLRGQAKGLFQFGGSSDPVERGLTSLFPDNATWNSKKITDQQRLLSTWQGHGDSLDKTPFEKCQKDAAARMMQSGQAFDLEALSASQRKAAAQDSLIKEKMVNVSKESLKVCTAMAEACALEVAEVCGVSKGLVVDPASALKSNSQQKAPPARPPAPGTLVH